MTEQTAGPGRRVSSARNEPTPIVMYGAAGYAAAMRDMIVHGFDPPSVSVVAHIDDFQGDKNRELDGAPIIGFDTWRASYRDTLCLIGIGRPADRRRLAERIGAAGGRFSTVLHILGPVSPFVTAGTGTVVAYPVYVGPYTSLGTHAHIMPMAVIGHDVTIGNHVTVCSAASIAGYVVIEDDVFVGTGAVIVNGTVARPMRIGRGAHIAAGAVVTRSVPPGTAVAGNPARPVRELAAERSAARRGR